MRWRSIGVAALQFGRLDRLGARDLEPAGLLLGADAVGRDRLFLRNARRLDGFARGDIGLLDRAVARDFERPDAFVLGDAGGFGWPRARRCQRLPALVAVDLQIARCVCSAAIRLRRRARVSRLRRCQLLRARGFEQFPARGCAPPGRCATSRSLRVRLMPASSSAWLRSISKRAGRLLGADAFGGEHLLARDLRRFYRLLRCDLGFLDCATC